MKVMIVTDAWHPQVNGVVTTLSRTTSELRSQGHEVLVINPGMFRTFPLPTYPEIRLSWMPGQKISEVLDDFEPDHIHIATEGPLGLSARRQCIRRKLKFTTSYHTQFPEYLRKRLPVPLDISYRWLRRFHHSATQTMVATNKMREQLIDRGFDSLVKWERGVDTDLFTPADNKSRKDADGPVWIYVGRVAVEKNIRSLSRAGSAGHQAGCGRGPGLCRVKSPLS